MKPGDLIRIEMLALGGTFKPALGTVLEVIPNLAGQFLRIRLLRSSGDVREFTSDRGGCEVISEGR